MNLAISIESPCSVDSEQGEMADIEFLAYDTLEHEKLCWYLCSTTWIS